MTAWVWVPVAAVIILHDRQISRHGGARGLRDRGLLEAACDRPVNRDAYAGAPVEDLAAAYAFGLARAHAFMDGNKRTAFVTAVTFLRVNGFSFCPDPVEGLRMMEGLAQGTVSEAELAGWVKSAASAI